MATQDAFNAAKMAFAMYGRFLNGVAQEIGLEKALALHSRQGELFGAMLGAAIKEKLGGRQLDIPAVAQVAKAVGDALGSTSEVVEGTPVLLKLNWGQCPIYEGLKQAGLEHATIRKACEGVAAVEDQKLREVLPGLSLCVKFRAAASDSCLEEYALEKQARVEGEIGTDQTHGPLVPSNAAARGLLWLRRS